MPLPDLVSEASGIAPGPRPGTFFVVDDATGTSQVALVRSDGSLLTRVRIPGVRAINAEALSVARCGNHRCLYLGDIGANAQREYLSVFQARIHSGPPWLGEATEFRFRYPRKSMDAEGMFVTSSRVVIVSKPPRGSGLSPRHQVFTGSLSDPAVSSLREVGTFALPRPIPPLQSLVTGNVVTDLAFDGSRVLALSYDQLVIYTAPNSSADPARFFEWPSVQRRIPFLAQAEGVAGLSDGCGYAIVSEAGGSTPAKLSIQRC